MISQRVTVKDSRGFHLRSAAEVMKLAQRSGSRVVIRRDDTDQSAGADSILDLILLAATAGTELVVEVEGPLEQVVASAIHELFENGGGI